MNDEEPRVSAEEMIARLEPAMSPWKRVRGVAALVAGVAGTVFVSALWWSEPGSLPGRTQLAFGLFTAFCLAWACYGGWLLTRRAPLFATDRVIAGWLALAASAATTALVVAVAAQPVAGLVGGGTFVAVSAVLTVRAHARRAALLRRKRELTGEGER
ncbi:hypothetical protein [Nonomuraea basaltis]|uniref:hypothetical protein n=1 Tax=Nonomuraea basaltis TaxID=2495887 RepID=UPI00110C5289|nr:hypothetical protein [Nonomuraea basaltis]TMR94257.1 hypothetical protein EJK15_34755 [Nonomuraea basaltis]